MGNVPRQRRAGQTGGGGRINQTSNRAASQNRGGRPHAGGGGTKKGCAVTAVALAGGPVTGVAATGYGLVELVRSIL